MNDKIEDSNIRQICKNLLCKEENPQPLDCFSPCPSGIPRRECRKCLKDNKDFMLSAIEYLKKSEK